MESVFPSAFQIFSNADLEKQYETDLQFLVFSCWLHSEAPFKLGFTANSRADDYGSLCWFFTKSCYICVADVSFA